jgi:general stress protein 26
MDEQITNFIDSNKICVFSVLRPDGSVHAASLHYTNNADYLEFYFATHKTSRKAASLLSGEAVKASMVIGFSEAEMVTLQMDGVVEIISADTDIARAKEIHYAKHESAKKFDGDPNTVFLRFKPNWWRYSEFMSKPPVFIEST